jgi:hypothetical protein
MLELKGVEAVSFYMCGDGKIGIKQFSTELMTTVHVNITLDQFREFEKWVTRNEDEINDGWNNGVDL